MDHIDLIFVDKTVGEIGTGQEKVLEILQAIQNHFGYLPKEALERVCELTDITPASIAGVSTFYNQFRHQPAGRHIIHICVGTACHVKGSERIYDAFRRYLAIPEGEDTDSAKSVHNRKDCLPGMLHVGTGCADRSGDLWTSYP